MRYDSKNSLIEENLQARKDVMRHRVALRRLIVILNKKQLSPSERKTLDLSMQTAHISQTEVNQINNNELPWP